MPTLHGCELFNYLILYVEKEKFHGNYRFLFFFFALQPERIDPQRARGYDVRSDVWSLGITLMEVATGYFPYPKWNSVFEQLYQVVQGDPPRLSPNGNGNHFTSEFVTFVNTWLVLFLLLLSYLLLKFG